MASSIASQAAPSIRATIQGVAYTRREPEPTSFAVSSRSTRVETSPFIPTVISIANTSFLSSIIPEITTGVNEKGLPFLLWGIIMEAFNNVRCS